MEADFSGYATKAGLKCSDGRTITSDAFKHQDGQKVPLVWQHGHADPKNVLGYALLQHRDDGIYAYGFFNETESGQSAKTLVKHGDVVALSIWANKLIEKSKSVLHGAIREVSLVLSGANPGALIDNVNLAHSDGEVETLEDEAVIFTGLPLEFEHADSDMKETEDKGKTVQEVYDSLTDEQKDVVHFMIGAALEASDATAEHSDDDESDDDESDDEETITHQEGNEEMTINVFEQKDVSNVSTPKAQLTHDQLAAIVTEAKKYGSFKEAFLSHATTYGIENIDFLFPDAKTLANSPELVTRKQEWVNLVINGVKKSPFSRIKTLSADLTLDQARAKGYVKGRLKKEEWFALQKRVTTPTTIYKKQKLDRDDIIDITDLDVVAWLKAEMRIMLDEEIARAILVGDGREIDDDDKVDETCIRPIVFEDDFYAHKVTIANNVVGDGIVEAILRARPFYHGKGTPDLFVTEALLTDILLVKDTMGRRLYSTMEELATTLRVGRIVTVPPMEGMVTNDGELIAVLVNLNDYTAGADKGGQVSMFDDFDINYNQFKYLMESRMSGALTGFKTALVISRTSGTRVTPGVPTFVAATGVVTIPSTTGVTYKQDGTDRTAGAQTAIAAGATTTVEARPNAGYYFPHNTDEDWTFTRTA